MVVEQNDTTTITGAAGEWSEPTITPVAPLVIPIERPKFSTVLEYARPLPETSIVSDESIIDKVKYYARAAALIAGLTPHLVTLIIGLFMKSWKTTIGAIIAGASGILSATGVITISPEVQSAILTIALFVVGFFAADAKPNA